MFQEKNFIQPKKTVKASNNNGLVDSANYSILSPKTNSTREIFQFSMIAYQMTSDGRNSYVKFGKARLFGFPGANSKQLSIYIDVNLESSNSDAVITYVGINDPLNGSNKPQIDTVIQNTDSVIQNTGTIIKKCRFYGSNNSFLFCFNT